MMRRTGSECGVSLLEALVALAVTGVALAIALQLWSAAFRMVHASGNLSRNPSEVAAMTSLKRDVHAASSVSLPIWAPLWSTEPLRLRVRDGSHVRFELDGDALVRVERVRTGAERSRQLLARPIAGWRWRLLPGGVLEVELDRRIAADAWRVDLATAEPELHTDRYWLAFRGGSRW